MSSKPNAFRLSADSYSYVLANRHFLGKTVLYNLPLMLAVAVFSQLAMMNGIPYVGIAATILMAVIISSFILSWHRVNLAGEGEARATNIFMNRGPEWVFIAVFVGLSLALKIYGVGVDVAARLYVDSQGGQISPMAGKIIFAIMFVAYLLGAYAFIRLLFIMPALSVGVKMTLLQAWKVAKGMIWPIFWSGVIFVIMLSIFFAAYTLIFTSVIEYAIGADTVLNTWQAVLTNIIFSAPLHAAVLVVFSLITTAVSKAYRWNMENIPA